MPPSALSILILTQYYPPEHGAPQNRLHDLAKRWTRAGQNVTVLTAMPNYPNGAVFPAYRGRFSMTEEIDGVRILRSAIFASRRKTTWIQLAVYFSFVFSSLAVGMVRAGRKHVLICESPPLFLGFTALLLAIRCRAKLVMNISDLWPESAVQLGLLGPGLKLRLLEWFEGLLYRRSSLVSCQTEGIVQGVKSRFPGAWTLLFPNGVDLDMFPAVSEKDPGILGEFGIGPDAFVVGYGGNHGRSQALGQVLEAAAILQKDGRRNIVFALFGDGPEKDALVRKAEEMDLANVRFHPSQARERMARIQSIWDVALVPLRDIPLFDGARPSKMFELMGGGIPFVFCGRGEGAEIARESGCAEIVEPENPIMLADRIRTMASMPSEKLRAMGQCGRAFVEVRFDRSVLADRFLSEIRRVAGIANMQ
jgi:glycosyltransferase involved in cell wall biosynthesis